MTPMTPPFYFIPGEYIIKHVNAGWEKTGCSVLRRAVFCDEQKIFEHDDSDAIDVNALTIAAITCVIAQPEQVVGTVRIHEKRAEKKAEAGIWFGSRLAVHGDFRNASALGKHLIEHAVCTAHARGCRQFYAHVQMQNEKLFQRLHWSTLDIIDVCGYPHALMQADLNFYPPRTQDEICFYPALRRAA
jgi:putative N-acetyltransferase (TIGR04045 family)